MATAVFVISFFLYSADDAHAGRVAEKALAGAAMGALIGGVVDGSDGAVAGTLIGGGIGAISGAKDKRDRRRHRHHHHHNPPPRPPHHGHGGPHLLVDDDRSKSLNRICDQSFTEAESSKRPSSSLLWAAGYAGDSPSDPCTLPRGCLCAFRQRNCAWR